MTPVSPGYALPETIRRLGRLEIRARHIVEGFLSGPHRSPFYGNSLEFREHRQYTPGDDLRDVDWKVWARQDRLYVKRYEEDTNLRATLLVDCSSSMSYGSGAMTKHEYAATAACAIAYLLLRQHDAVSCWTFDSKVRTRLPFSSHRGHLNDIAATLALPPMGPKTDVTSVLRDAAAALPRRGVVIVLSDLLGDLTQLRTSLNAFASRGHDIVVLHVLDDDELDFPFEDPARFEHLEGPELLECHPAALRTGYLAALEKFLQTAREQCAAIRADYALFRTSTPLDAALTALLSSRYFKRRGG